jgi:hypothetical protein
MGEGRAGLWNRHHGHFLVPAESRLADVIGASVLEPEVSFKSGPDLFQALWRKAAEVLEKALGTR